MPLFLGIYSQMPGEQYQAIPRKLPSVHFYIAVKLR